MFDQKITFPKYHRHVWLEDNLSQISSACLIRRWSFLSIIGIFDQSDNIQGRQKECCQDINQDSDCECMIVDFPARWSQSLLFGHLWWSSIYQPITEKYSTYSNVLGEGGVGVQQAAKAKCYFLESFKVSRFQIIMLCINASFPLAISIISIRSQCF